MAGKGEEAAGGSDPGCEGCVLGKGIEVTQPAAHPQDTKAFPFVAGTALSQGVCGHFHSTQSSWIGEGSTSEQAALFPSSP